MAHAKQGKSDKQEKKSAKVDKVADKAKGAERAKPKAAKEIAAAETKVTAKAAAKAQKSAKATGSRRTEAEKAAKTAQVAAAESVRDDAKATKAAARAAKAAEAADLAAAETERAAETAAVSAEQVEAADQTAKAEARRAKEDYKAAKTAAKAVLKAEDRELDPAQAKKFVEQVAAQILAAEAATADAALPVSPLTELLRLKPGAPVDLAALEPRATPGVETRAQAEAEFAVLAARLGELQERLYAAAVGGSKRRVLLVLQGMDTSGKGGTVRHVAGLLDPNGTRIKAFKAPTPEELEHDFLWRIRENAPAAGQVGIFDRSQYEDVLVAKVRKLALPMHIGRRYGSINKFEKSLVDDGCVVVKCFLHISPEEQRERLLARLDDPDKHWKYNPNDVDDRLLWPDFQEAYRIALERCGTEPAPWHVIPADRKWYRNYAVLRLLIEALESIDPQYPAGDFDLAAERARVLAS